MHLLLPLLLASPSVADDAPRPFTCCDVPALTRLVDRYVDLVEAVTEGEPDSRISARAYALRAQLQPISGLPRDEDAVVASLQKHVSRIRNSADQIRDDLDDIGRQVVFLALRHEGGELTVVEAHCPDRGPWLQRSDAAPKSPWGGGCARWR